MPDIRTGWSPASYTVSPDALIQAPPRGEHNAVLVLQPHVILDGRAHAFLRLVAIVRVHDAAPCFERGPIARRVEAEQAEQLGGPLERTGRHVPIPYARARRLLGDGESFEGPVQILLGILAFGDVVGDDGDALGFPILIDRRPHHNGDYQRMSVLRDDPVLGRFRYAVAGQLPSDPVSEGRPIARLDEIHRFHGEQLIAAVTPSIGRRHR